MLFLDRPSYGKTYVLLHIWFVCDHLNALGYILCIIRDPTKAFSAHHSPAEAA